MRRRKLQITCSDVSSHLGEELASLMTRRAFAQVRRHLIRCPNCEATFDSVNKVVRLYRLYPDPLLTSNMRRRLHAAIALSL